MLDTLILVIPVLLILVVIMTVVKLIRSDEGPWESMNGIIGLIPVTVVVIVSILIVAGMGAALAPYSWDEDSGELTINKNVGSGSQDWDSYGSDVKSLIIKDGVTIGAGAFDSLTSLEYIKIGEGVTIASGAFGEYVMDPLGAQVTPAAGEEYAGAGDGTLYRMTPEMFTYGAGGTNIIGLASGYESAVAAVIPREYQGHAIERISSSFLPGNETVKAVLMVQDSNLIGIGFAACRGATALETVRLLAPFESIDINVFRECTALVSLQLPSTLKTIGTNAFTGDTALESVSIPGGVQSVAATAFGGCTGVTEVSFGSGFSATLDSTSFQAWTFYDSDGTTELDKTDATALAGFTFQGTASALVKVVQGAKSLSIDQLKAVKTLTEQAEKTALLEPDYEAKESTEILSEETELASA